MAEQILIARELSRRFGKQVAVDNVSLSVPKGAVYGFLGPNGAGKSTTIRMLLGLMRSNTGSVTLFGHDLKKERRAAMTHVGAIVEAPALYGNLSGRQNLEIIRRMTGVAKQRIDEVLDAVRMTDAQHKAAGKYSMGMKQRLAVAIALLRSPSLLILDEPTNGMDPQGVREMRELIRDLPKQTGSTVFVSSHLLGEVEQIATHVGVISKGKQLFDGSLAELMTRNRERLRISVDQPELVEGIVKEIGLDPVRSQQQPDQLTLFSPQDADAIDPAAINALLVNKGVRVRELVLTRATLEEAFLDLTGTEEAPV